MVGPVASAWGRRLSLRGRGRAFAAWTSVALVLSLAGLGFSGVARASATVQAPNGALADYVSAPGVIGAFPAPPAFSDSRLHLGSRPGGSDGVSLEPLRPCSTATMIVLINARALPRALRKGDLVLNAWFDWGRAGNWTGAGCGIADWEVQNLHIPISEVPRTGVLALPVVFRTGDQVSEFWYRVTLSLGTDFASFAGAAPAPLGLGDSEDHYYNNQPSTGAAEFATGSTHAHNGHHGRRGKAAELVAPAATAAQGGGQGVSCDPASVAENHQTFVKLNINPPGLPKPDFHGTLLSPAPPKFSVQVDAPPRPKVDKVDGRYQTGDDYRAWLHIAANQKGAAPGDVIVDGITFKSTDDSHGPHFEDDGWDKGLPQTVDFNFTFTRLGGTQALKCEVTVRHEHLAPPAKAPEPKAPPCVPAPKAQRVHSALDVSDQPVQWMIGSQYSEPHGVIFCPTSTTQPPGGGEQTTTNNPPPTPNNPPPVIFHSLNFTTTAPPSAGVVLDPHTIVTGSSSELQELNVDTGQALATQTPTGLDPGATLFGIQAGDGMVVSDYVVHDSMTGLNYAQYAFFNASNLSPRDFTGKTTNIFTFKGSSNVFPVGAAIIPTTVPALDIAADVNGGLYLGQLNANDGTVSNAQTIAPPTGMEFNGSGVEFDQESNRFYIVGTLDSTMSTGGPNTVFLDARDPTTFGLVTEKQMTFGGLADFPTFGFDSQALYISYDLFTGSGPTQKFGVYLVRLPRPTFIPGTPAKLLGDFNPTDTFGFPIGIGSLESNGFSDPLSAVDLFHTSSTSTSRTFSLLGSVDNGQTFNPLGGLTPPDQSGAVLLGNLTTGTAVLNFLTDTPSGFTETIDLLKIL
jgi:hypothetical protein